MATRDIPEATTTVVSDATAEMAFWVGFRAESAEPWYSITPAQHLSGFVLDFARAEEAAMLALGADQLERRRVAINARRVLMELAGLAMALALDIDRTEGGPLSQNEAPQERSALLHGRDRLLRRCTATVEEIARHGLGWVCDTTPTQPVGGWGVAQWQQYFYDAHQRLQEKARAVLEGRSAT